MRFLRIILLLISATVFALFAGVFASGTYQRVRYPGIQDTDGLYDIGLVFIVGFVAVFAVELITWLVFFRRRRRRT